MEKEAGQLAPVFFVYNISIDNQYLQFKLATEE
jgi:hypothetical protein